MATINTGIPIHRQIPRMASGDNISPLASVSSCSVDRSLELRLGDQKQSQCVDPESTMRKVNSK